MTNDENAPFRPWSFVWTASEGIGKPEPLKADLTGYWSRRINDEHRLVYSATTTEIIVIACRYHYGKGHAHQKPSHSSGDKMTR